jgi:hypothetical protein
MSQIVREINRRHSARANLTLDSVPVGERPGKPIDVGHRGIEAGMTRLACDVRFT